MTPIILRERGAGIRRFLVGKSNATYSRLTAGYGVLVRRALVLASRAAILTAIRNATHQVVRNAAAGGSWAGTYEYASPTLHGSTPDPALQAGCQLALAPAKPVAPSVPESVADCALGFEDVQATSVAGMATPPMSEATIRIIPATSRACHHRGPRQARSRSQ